MKPPAFQFYADDFIGGTLDLTAEEIGSYILLLCFQWSRGAIPTEKPVIDRIGRANVSAAVLAKFPGGKNERLERVREEQTRWKTKSALGGQRSAAAKSSAHDHQTRTNGATKAQPNGNQTPTTSQPNGNQTPTIVPTNGATKSQHSLLQSPTPGTAEEQTTKGGRTDRFSIPNVEEVLAVGGIIGLSPSECRDWHRDREIEGWADKDGVDIGNWRVWLTRHRNWMRSQAKAKPAKGESREIKENIEIPRLCTL